MTKVGTAVEKAVQTVRQGGLIIYPTEAVYGLGGDYRQAEVVSNILALKHRPISQGLILVAGHIGHILPLIQPLSGSDLAAALATWPGHHTWIFPASDKVPAGVRGPDNTVAVRLSAHPVIIDLCQQLNHALISTSANKRGQATPTVLQQLVSQWPHEVDYFLDLPLGHAQKPSTIRIAGDGHTVR
ncbi:L-threonylcarbamoyladenylate synthase [Marinicella gelatinilytica]|uniref:L-threonylcarbamoyladenylate synthase n=1 Tax=Marinicella gelatinilytica TaxID=2996017 RepID=UPI0022610370|nr:L-threonylcarbamoyladenylate synthase [Marinicella gelatinilytica]MCX7545724.1 L-threonylcarbamoyladenylate synthase [Marinicella gelatinilytica]